MTLSDDEWIKSHSPIEAEKLHALGLITFMWNACEYKLFELFHLTFGITPQLAWLLVHDLGSVSISDPIKAFLENAFPEPRTIQNEIELIQNALEAFDRCRQNRNQFTHFTLEHDLEARTVHLRRQQKGPLISRVPFPTELSDMRRVAGEIIGMNNMLNSITTYIKNHGTDQAVPLPDTVAPPELLSSPAPQAHKEPQPQRPPSVLRLTEKEWMSKCRKERRTLRDGLEAG